MNDELVPEKKAWEPKQYEIVRLTEYDKRTKAQICYPFLIDTITEEMKPKRDAKGTPQIETVQVKTTSKGTINVTRQVLVATKLYSGTVFASWMQYPQPRRGIQLADLSQPEA
jgi:hypothetical protein